MRIALPLRPFSFLILFVLCISWFAWATAPAGADTNVNGTISTDTTWTLAGSPYIVTSSITVKGTDGVDSLTTLSIEPGVEVRFNRYQMMTIGASSGDPGALVAQGTAADPIVFTSNEATPAAGDWYNLNFSNTTDDASTIMEHCVVEYAGYSQGAIYLNNASPTFRNTQVRHSKNKGFYIATGVPVIDTCQLSDNLNYDLYYTGTVGGTVSGCTLNSGIYLVASGTVGFSGNTINQNNAFPITTYADNVGGIVDGNTIANVDSASYLQVNQGTVSRDATWNAQIPYYIYGNPTVKGTDGADRITTLTLSPGALLKFKKGTRMIIGASSGDPGALVAQGSADDPIVFTSNEATPAAGDWYNLNFSNTTDDASTIMEHCMVEYSGYSQGAINLNNASPNILNCDIRHSKNAGIYGTGSGTIGADIRCNTIYSNKYGIHWMASPAPEMHYNNFSNNSDYGLYYTGADTLNAENNWWDDSAGPNTGGDATSGNIDVDPWSPAENQCIAGGENHPPHEPNSPEPVDQAVRVQSDNGVTLGWSGGDPDPLDTVTYSLSWGTDPANLAVTAQALDVSEYTITGLSQGTTYYWQIIALDNRGLETSGPVWHLTTDGDPPDLIISQVAINPAGGLQTGQSVTFAATVQNSGSGPVVDPFTVDFKVDGVSIGTAAVDHILLAGQTIETTQTWSYADGNPAVEVSADNQTQVSESDETNNSFNVNLLSLVDNSPPVLVSTAPADGSAVQQVQKINVTLADSKGLVDDAIVLNGFSVRDSAQQSVSGTLSESNDTFTFLPDNLPLADDIYHVDLIAADTYGNTQNYSFAFTVDTQPPAKPIISGGVVDSGTVQPRPAQNSSNRFVFELTGTREPGTSVWINGVERVDLGDTDWSVQILLQPGDNAIEIWLVDKAVNRGSSEWVDIAAETGAESVYRYDASGRMKSVDSE